MQSAHGWRRDEIRSGGIRPELDSSAGANVDGFERELCSAVGARHVAALSSGTSAIHLSLILIGVRPGDYVHRIVFHLLGDC